MYNVDILDFIQICIIVQPLPLSSSLILYLLCLHDILFLEWFFLSPNSVSVLIKVLSTPVILIKYIIFIPPMF